MMKTTLRPLTLIVAVAALSLASPSGAQEKAAKAKKAVVVRPAVPVAPLSPVVVIDDVVVDTAKIADEVQQAIEAAVLTSRVDQATVNASTRKAIAEAMAQAGSTMAEVQVDTQEALRRAMTEAAIVGHVASRESERAIEKAVTAQVHAQVETNASVQAAVEQAVAAAHVSAIEIGDAFDFDDQQTDKEKAAERREKEREAAELRREKEQEAREKAQEAREKALEKNQEAREKAREKAQEDRERQRENLEARREAERERRRSTSDRAEDLYEQAMQSIDEEDWNDALRPLNRLMEQNARVDAALYWSGYAQGKLNRTAAALAALARLQKDFPTSRWAKEGKALEMEVRGKSGQTPRADEITSDDDDLKLMAVSALAQSDPQEALPLLAKLLQSPSAGRKVRERSLFVLAQIGTEQAGNAIAEVARGNSSPELQRKAIQYLGVFGGAGNRKVLSDIYGSTTDNSLRKQILNSFMVAGDKARVLSAAKTEKDPALRSDAIRLLGVMGGTTELSQMYTTATTTQEKKDILHALFLSGAVEPVAAAARGEKDKDVRLAAVRNLGLMGRKSQDVLGEMYRAEPDPEVKKEVLNAFFLQGNSTRLVEIARVEKDPVLKKEAVHWLSLMNSKESRAFMMELLKD